MYAYEFSDPSPPDDYNLTTLTFPLGAAHSTELQYVFQRIPALDTVPPFSSAQLALSDQMIAYWTRFAATGSPDRRRPAGSGRPAPDWPRFSASRPDIQELVPGATAPEPAARFAAAHNCGFWAGLGFLSRLSRLRLISGPGRRRGWPLWLITARGGDAWVVSCSWWGAFPRHRPKRRCGPARRTSPAWCSRCRTAKRGLAPPGSDMSESALSGEPGLRRREATARKFLPDFGVALYCGFRVQPGSTPEQAIREHRDVVRAVRR